LRTLRIAVPVQPSLALPDGLLVASDRWWSLPEQSRAEQTRIIKPPGERTQGQSGQSNALFGEISVTVMEIYPNGTMLVHGEKNVRINRGNEQVRVTGLVRAADISPDNRVPSTRVANADVQYVGRGEIARASRQGWLQRFFSIISPF
jgi:flagellar basal body L-ring protein FlgH